MLNIKDIAKPAGLLVGLAALTAVGLTAAYFLTRDRAMLRRVVRTAAGSVERVSSALAETREEIADLWAAARDEARQEMDEAAFAAGAHGEPAPDAPAPVEETVDEASRKTPPRRRTPRAPAGSKGKVSA